ncbi:MAG: hypothetical protein BGP16_13160 [Sphingobium sp. 66-54]|nr:MAG: hypothetical protein BGP16_13160 [Sphingobium sp. 66-54]
MKRFFYSAASVAALVVASVGAQATTFTGSYTVNADANENGGLGIQTANLFDLVAGFDLTSAAPSKTVDLFRIWTNEGAINADDFNARDISVDFAFTLPSAANGSIPGQTVGDADWFFGWVNESGVLTWSDSKVFSFANGTQLQVELQDATFNWGLIDLREGYKHGANVKATFTLLPAVPEPATWAMMVVGFGLAGGILRSRKRTIVSFA